MPIRAGRRARRAAPRPARSTWSGRSARAATIFAVRPRPAAAGGGRPVAIGAAGAYGAVMASTYNSRPLVPEMLVNGGEVAVIRPRESLDALMAADRLPPWLELAKV